MCCEGEPQPPGPFDLLYPAPGASDVERNPVMQWAEADNVWYYTIWVADNPEFIDPRVDGFETSNTQISLPPNYLDEGTTHYWRVDAISPSGEVRPGTPELATFTTVGVEVPCPGDVDGDGLVDLADLNAVLASFGQTGDLPGDANADGQVDLLDLNIVLGAFGVPCG